MKLMAGCNSAGVGAWAYGDSMVKGGRMVDLPEILHTIFFLIALPELSPLFCPNLGGQLPPCLVRLWVGVTSVSLPVVNSYVSKTCDKGVKGRRMLLCRVELCVTEMSASRQILMIYIKTVASVAPC